MASSTSCLAKAALRSVSGEIAARRITRGNGIAGPSTLPITPSHRLIHSSPSSPNPSSTLSSQPSIDPSILVDSTTSSSSVQSSTNTTTSKTKSQLQRRNKPMTLQEEQQLEREDEWKRNLRRVREWRKEMEGLKSRLSKVQPPNSSSSSSTHQTPPNPKTHLLSTLLSTTAQLGHSPTHLSPPFLPYISGTRSNLHIIDLEQTIPLLRKAANVVREVVKGDGVVLFVGTRGEMKGMVEKAVGRMEGNGFGVAGRKWMAGTLTNSSSFFGIQPVRTRSHTPDLVIILNPSENLGLVRECTAMKVPTIGIVDTNCDPRLVTYAIPANMESMRTCELIANTLSIAGQAGREKRLRDSQNSRGR